MRQKRSGFTLVEAILVVLIIAIIVMAALPKYLDIRTKAMIASEDAVIGALRSAISIDHMRRVANGINPKWPGSVVTEDPFTLLSQAPP
jgi:MSHA pilin protein MshA